MRQAAGPGEVPALAVGAWRVMSDRLSALPVAARVADGGHQVVFPPGRDAATFKVAGLPGEPDVEVSAQDDGRLCCHYTGASQAQAALVIARLPVPGHPDVQVIAGDTLTATWNGIEIEWEHLPRPGEHGLGPNVAAALLAHLAVLGGGHRDDGEEDPR
jgi:hypothetical protein